MTTTITTAMVKELREATGAGVLDAKKALENAGGDFEKALEELRKKGLARVAKSATRQANEGLIELYAHPGNRVGVILELNCETDFVARNEAFKELAHELALHIAAMGPRYVSREDVPQNVLDEVKAELRAQALAEGKPEDIAEKIVAGRLNKFFEENVVLEQSFVKDEDVKVIDLINNAISLLGENIVLRRFARYELGEELP